jgi:hypothetical protein
MLSSVCRDATRSASLAPRCVAALVNWTVPPRALATSRLRVHRLCNRTPTDDVFLRTYVDSIRTYVENREFYCKAPPLCNLYVSMLQRLGVEVDKFSSGTGTLRGLEPVG